MGCRSSKNNSVVHPFSSNKPKSRNEIIPPAPPAAPASTPEPSEPEEEEEGLHQSSSVGSRRVATPAAITAVFAENEGLQYALRGTGMEQRVPISGIRTMEPLIRLPGCPNYPPPPHLTPSQPQHIITGSSPLQVYGTDSQVEFFRMLDKKIEEGPDYTPENDDHH